jgi:hypothetical protein
VPIIYVAEVFADIQTPVLLGDIQTTGYPDEYVIKNMTPERWNHIPVFLVDGPFKNPDGDQCQLIVPKYYSQYDDVSAVIKIPTTGIRGPVTPGEFLAQLKDVPGFLPIPLRVQRMMTREGARATCLRLVFDTAKARNIWTSHKRLHWHQLRCEISSYKTSAPLMVPDPSKDKFRPHRRHDPK